MALLFSCTTITLESIHNSDSTKEAKIAARLKGIEMKLIGIMYMNASQEENHGKILRFDEYENRLPDNEIKLNKLLSIHSSDKTSHEKRLKDIEHGIEMLSINISEKLDDHEKKLQDVLNKQKNTKFGIEMLSVNMSDRFDGLEKKLQDVLNEQKDIKFGIEMLSVNMSARFDGLEKKLQDVLNEQKDIKFGIEMLSGNISEKLDDHEKKLQDALKELKLTEIKPVNAIQINTYSGSYGRDDLAIDGKIDTCVSTKFTRNPWWCADMGDTYHVGKVIVKNNNCYTLSPTPKLRVGVTNTRPVVGRSLSLNAYTLCGEKHGEVEKVTNVHCPDGVYGQYLIIQYRSLYFSMTF